MLKNNIKIISTIYVEIIFIYYFIFYLLAFNFLYNLAFSTKSFKSSAISIIILFFIFALRILSIHFFHHFVFHSDSSLVNMYRVLTVLF